jgi:hypothetical protein
MSFLREPFGKWLPATAGFAMALTLTLQPMRAQDKPTGAPLVLSTIETEQEIPLAVLLPDGKTARFVTIRLHWNPKLDVGPNDEAASFTLDLPADNPAAPVFTAQLWSASLASAMAWQEPWQGARWKVLQTPVTDGTGIDAALAVGMISTSARRPYPPGTIIMASLNPDGSLGPVSHLVDRMDAAAKAGMKRVIIASAQRFDTDSTGEVVNMMRHAAELHLECVPVDDLVAATEKTMNDPLPDMELDSSVPKYGNEVATYIDDFAHREQDEAASGLKFAPGESDLGTYPPHLAAIWKSVYADFDAGQEAYRAGEVYVAYHLFTRANGRMNGANALAGQTPATFDVKTALAESTDLHDRLHTLMNPPSIDQGNMESALLVAEMADWAFTINSALEGAQLVTKQAYSQRSDASEAEKDRARESILFANAQCKYLLTQADFYNGLLAHLSKSNPSSVTENAAHLLPQLIPAQLATARSFTEGIRASELRDGLLFDPRLVAYVNVLREVKANWDARKSEKESEGPGDTPAPTTGGTNTDSTPVRPDGNDSSTAVGFNPGSTYMPPETALSSTAGNKSLSDASLCLIWVDHDCEIATLTEKYLRLSGTMDAAHEWHVKDRAKLDALLLTAEVGARRGIAFAEKADLDPSVLAMIYERAAHQRVQNDDASALDALRNYWRCALLGNVCWQLAHPPKALPVNLSALPPDAGKTNKNGDKNTATPEVAKTNDNSKKGDASNPPAASTNEAVVVNPPDSPRAQEVHEVVTPVPAPADTNTVVVVPPTAPAITNDAAVPPIVPDADNHATVAVDPPVAPIATNEDTAPPAPEPATNETPVAVDPPVVPIASHEDMDPPAATNANVSVDPPVAPIATNDVETPAPPTAPNATTNSVSATAPATHDASPGPATPDPDANIPVAPVARAQDYAGGSAPAATNSAPVIGPIPPSTKPDNADDHAF